jgi:hypothetical protein
MFSIDKYHPLADRCGLFTILLAYQNHSNIFRNVLGSIKNDIKINTNIVNPIAEKRRLSINTTTINHDIIPTIDYYKLYLSIIYSLNKEHSNLLLYCLLHENVSFRTYICQRTDLDLLIIPLLTILYEQIDISKNHVYMIINNLIILTQTNDFTNTCSKIILKDKINFYKDSNLNNLSLYDLIIIILLHTIQFNINKLKEPSIFNNVLAALCNITVTNNNTNSISPIGIFVLHNIAAHRIITVLGQLIKKFINLQVIHETQILQIEAGELLNEEDDVRNELSTCIEFLHVIFELINRCLHSNSIQYNTNIIYWLLQEQIIFLPIVPFSSLFQENLINNIHYIITYFDTLINKNMKMEKILKLITNEIKKPNVISKISDKSIFERGKFSYHEQNNSHEFFLSYMYQLASSLRILPASEEEVITQPFYDELEYEEDIQEQNNEQFESPNKPISIAIT